MTHILGFIFLMFLTLLLSEKCLPSRMRNTRTSSEPDEFRSPPRSSHRGGDSNARTAEYHYLSNLTYTVMALAGSGVCLLSLN
jgi:hypothetical protein